MLTSERLIEIAATNRVNAELIRRLPALGLDQCMLTAGCLFQTVWNQKSGLPAGWGIKDYDIFYFDEDVSWEAENSVINAVQDACRDLDISIEVKNQARVHLWYAQRFGRPYPQLRSAKEGVDRYLISGTCIGLDIRSGEIYAPYGLTDADEGLLRINPLNHQPDLFIQKAKSYQERWSWLKILSS
ncbi:nucleotidyltransferase family protein [Pseudomonas sp. 2FG]|uniref:nucleotidyltransferase family protein n=1 Tax=Pseudomonas sp. 2FG TaxID=2502191 RepID=UPI0010F5307E|nr:nucleotidyltransferase family protein [Pseudomonas sp. 2FG]